MRTEQLNIALTRDEARSIRALAAHHGIHRAELLRMLIKRAADDLRPAR